MSFADATDPIVDALRAVLLAGVPPRLVAMIGDGGIYNDANPSPVKSTYGMPMPMTLAPTLRLPAFFVYRNASSWRSVGKHDYLLTEFVVAYVLNTTPAHQLEEHWPLLRAVFRACVESIEADDGGALGDAGVIEFEEERTTARYALITDSGHKNAYPSFTASFWFTHDDALPTLSPVELPYLTGLHGDVIKHPEEVTLASFAADFPAVLVTEDGDEITTEDGAPLEV